MRKEAKDGQTEKYKQRIKRLEKEVRELKSKNKTLEAAFEKTVKVLKGSVEDITVQELIDGANNGQSIKEVKEESKHEGENCPECSEELKIMPIRGGEIAVCGNCTYRRKI